MNMIGLTGANPHAMAKVAEQLLAAVTASGHAVAIALYVEDVDQVRGLRSTKYGLVEIWRIGADKTRPTLDFELDAFIDDTRGDETMAAAVDRQLARYIDCITHGRGWLAAHFPPPERLTHE